MRERRLSLSADNLAVMRAAGHPVYLIRTPDAADWDYNLPIGVAEMPDLKFKRHLLMWETRGHREALELELVSGVPPSRSALLGKTLVQVRGPARNDDDHSQ